MFLLKRLFDVTETKTPIHKSSIALKQKEPTIHASIKTPQIRPAIAQITGEWKSEKAVSIGRISRGETPLIEIESESV